MSEDNVGNIIGSKPYATWLEDIVRTLFEEEPDCISLQMRTKNNQVMTAYWNCSQDDRCVMMDAMRDDAMMDWVRNNSEELAEILKGGDEE